MSEQLATATDLITESNERRQEMRETLVNHKREALIQHKTQSAVLQKELEAIHMERERLEQQKDKLLDELGEMENAIKTVEEQIRAHSQTSAIVDGRVCGARSEEEAPRRGARGHPTGHARQKRRRCQDRHRTRGLRKPERREGGPH